MRSCRHACGHPGAAPQHPPRASHARLPRRRRRWVLHPVPAAHTPGPDLWQQQQLHLPKASGSRQQGGPPARRRFRAARRRNHHPTTGSWLQTPALERQRRRQITGRPSCCRPAPCLHPQRLRIRLSNARMLHAVGRRWRCRSLRPWRARCCARWATRHGARLGLGRRRRQAPPRAAEARLAGRLQLQRPGLSESRGQSVRWLSTRRTCFRVTARAT